MDRGHGTGSSPTEMLVMAATEARLAQLDQLIAAIEVLLAATHAQEAETARRLNWLEMRVSGLEAWVAAYAKETDEWRSTTR